MLLSGVHPSYLNYQFCISYRSWSTIIIAILLQVLVMFMWALLPRHSKYFIYFVVYHVKETGWVHISNEDCKDLHYKYQEEKGNSPEWDRTNGGVVWLHMHIMSYSVCICINSDLTIKVHKHQTTVKTGTFIYK